MNSFEARYRYILEQIDQRGSVSVIDLAENLAVSDMTIRRDLNELEKVGMIRRVHGGAVSARGRSFEPPLFFRSTENKAIKQILGKYASQMVLEGDSITLDVGSTTYEIAVNLENKHNITLVTPSIPIANLFLNRSDVRLILPGGIVRPGESSMVGEPARRNLETLFVDRLFLGVAAINSQAGLTEYNMDDSDIKKAMIRNAKEVVLVLDSSKFEKTAFASVAPIKALHHLITNEEPPKSLLSVLKDNNVTVHIVNETETRILKFSATTSIWNGQHEKDDLATDSTGNPDSREQRGAS